MKRMIIKEIIERNFPELRRVDLKGHYDHDVSDPKNEKHIKASRKEASGEPKSKDWRTGSLKKKKL